MAFPVDDSILAVLLALIKKIVYLAPLEVERLRNVNIGTLRLVLNAVCNHITLMEFQ